MALETAGTLKVGAPVSTADAGTVTKVVSGNPHINQPASSCAGQGYPANYVEITGGDGYVTRYVHVTATVAQGDPVSAGQQIGTVDISGCTSGPHVHMARHSSAGVIVNFTIPCDNSHFDAANTFYDDSDGLDHQ